MTELATLPPHALAVSRDVSDDITISDMLYRSGYFPDVKTAAEAFTKIRCGREFGLGPVTALRELFVVKGRVGMSAALVGALIRKSGNYDYEIAISTDTEAVIQFTRKIADGTWQTLGVATFTIQDAEIAGLLNSGPMSPWQKYRKNMLLSRAMTNGAKAYCPDVLMGSIYTPDELSESVAYVSEPARLALMPPVSINPALVEMYQQEADAARYYGISHEPVENLTSDAAIIAAGTELHARVSEARENSGALAPSTHGGNVG